MTACLTSDDFRHDTETAGIGERVYCFSRGQPAEVVRITAGWPWGTLSDRGGRAGMGPILNGRLLLSVILDSEVEAAARFGIDPATIRRFRRRLETVRQDAMRRRQSALAVARGPQGPARARAARSPAMKPPYQPRTTRPERIARDAAIAAAHAAGKSVEECAAEWGVSRITVWRACRNKMHQNPEDN